MLLVGTALAVVMKPPNQSKEATPGRKIMPKINRRGANQAASAEANVHAAALVIGADLHGAKSARCRFPSASSVPTLLHDISLPSQPRNLLLC